MFTTFEFCFFAYILWIQIHNEKLKRLILLFSIFFVCFQILYFFTTKIKRLDSIPIGIESITLFIFILLLFYEQFKTAKDSSIVNSPWFWFSTGIMLYLAGSFFFNILVNNIDKKIGMEYWHVTYLFDTIKNIFFSVGLIFVARQPNKSTGGQTSSVPYLDMI